MWRGRAGYKKTIIISQKLEIDSLCFSILMEPCKSSARKNCFEKQKDAFIDYAVRCARARQTELNELFASARTIEAVIMRPVLVWHAHTVPTGETSRFPEESRPTTAWLLNRINKNDPSQRRDYFRRIEKMWAETNNMPVYLCFNAETFEGCLLAVWVREPGGYACKCCGASEAPESHACAVGECNVPATMMCIGCKRLCYCSETCQLTDWRARHRVECRALRASDAAPHA